MEKYLIGIDLGGTATKVGLFRAGDNLTLMDKASIPTCREGGLSSDGEDPARRMLTDGIDAARSLLEKAGRVTEGARIAGIGLGVPGPVIPSSDGRDLVDGCVNLGWGQVIPADILTELTGVDTVAVLNDANAAALGEWRFGESKTETPAFITLGTGIGGGVIRDGELYSGAFGSAGEFGHMMINPSHPLLSRILHSGKTDITAAADLEDYASASGIARIGRAASDALPEFENFFGDEEPTSRFIFDRAKEGDPRALELTDFFFHVLGRGLASIAVSLDPSAFIIGGGMIAAGDFLVDGLRNTYRQYAFGPTQKTPILTARLGSDAGIWGAAASLL